MKKVLWSYVVIGGINIVLAILNAVAIASSFNAINEVIRIILPFSGIKVSLAAVYQIFTQPDLIIKNIISYSMGYGVSIVLFISGVGVIFQKKWGRIFACIYAISMVVISIIGIPFVLVEFTKEFTHIEKYGFFEGIVWAGALLYILNFIGTLLYPVILLIFFSRPKIKEKFGKE